MGPLSILQPHVAASLLDLVGEFAFVYRVAADGSTHLEWSNIPFTEWTGRTEAELLQLGGWFAFIHEDDRERVLEHYRRANAGERVEFEFRLDAPDGLRWTRFTLQPVSDPEGGELRVCGATRDLTLHRRASADAQSREHLLRETLDALPISVWHVAKDGTVLDVNAAGRRMWGGDIATTTRDAEPYRRFNVRHSGTGQRIGPQGSSLREALDSGIPSVDTEVAIDLPDGSTRVLQSSIFPLHAPTGDVTGAICLHVDITAAKRLEAQMRQGQRMESIGRMAGGIAHDFNNLLTVIVGCAEIALQFGKGGDSTAEWEETLAAARRAAELTGQLLVFSRQQPVSPRIVDLSAVVRRVEGLVRRVIGERVHLRVDTAQMILPVNVDPSQFEQVLLNLAANARDAMPGGGTLVVRTDLHVVTVAEARRHPGLTAGTKMRLTVSDTGGGIPEAIRNRIFEPFFTTKSAGKGTGLGLAMCYGTVKQASGYIGVESTEGKGTTFWIYLPVVEGAVTDLPEVGVLKTERLAGGARVLLVEDERAVAELMRRALEFGGYTVMVANGGREALSILAGLTDPVDLLLTDVVMPNMRGTVLAKRVREMLPEMRVMFVSGYPGPLEEEFRDAPLLAKPFSPAELLRRVGEVLKA